MIEDLATLLMNKTCMERFNRAEVESVLTFLMAGGYLVDPNAPEVVTVPREELEEVASTEQRHEWSVDPVLTKDEQPLYD